MSSSHTEKVNHDDNPHHHPNGGFEESYNTVLKNLNTVLKNPNTGLRNLIIILQNCIAFLQNCIVILQNRIRFLKTVFQKSSGFSSKVYATLLRNVVHF